MYRADIHSDTQAVESTRSRVEGWKLKEFCSHDLLLFTFFHIYRFQRATFHFKALQGLQPISLPVAGGYRSKLSSHAQQTPWCKRLGSQAGRIRIPKRQYQQVWEGKEQLKDRQSLPKTNAQAVKCVNMCVIPQVTNTGGSEKIEKSSSLFKGTSRISETMSVPENLLTISATVGTYS
jgi:hypothetical protein